jgi:Phage portal protein, lambda family
MATAAQYRRSGKPVQLYGPTGRPISSIGGYGRANDRMIGPSVQNFDRKCIGDLATDVHYNISPYGRRTLVTLGRYLYFRSALIRGAIETLCRDTAGMLMFDYRGEDLDWKEQAEDLLYRHERVCDIAGPPNTLRTWRKSLLRALYMDGDEGTVLVKGDDGQPYLQTIPGHRIMCDEDTVKGGAFDGARCLDGVIVDSTNRPLAYRIVTSGEQKEVVYQDIPASAMSLAFLPIMAGQVRGFPILGLAAWDLQDIDETDRWEMLAQKGAASRVFQIFTESGEADPSADYIPGPNPGDVTAGTPTGLYREVIDGGLNSYFKANSGEMMKAVEFNRPARAQLDFKSQKVRETMAGSGLSIDYHLDLTKIGGAPARVLIDQINRQICDLQIEVLEPQSRRFDAYRLSVFMANGQLPTVSDWSNYEYQPGPKLSADEKYSSDVDAQEIRIGVKTRARSISRLGESLKDVRDQRQKEADDLFKRATELAAKYPTVGLNVILDRLENDSVASAKIEPPVAATTPDQTAP